MSERLKESVLKTEVFLGIPGVRIPLHPRGHKFSLALSIELNESPPLRMEWKFLLLCVDLVRTLSPFRYPPPRVAVGAKSKISVVVLSG